MMPPQPPTPASPPPAPPTHNGRRYLIGLGFGFIPMVALWISGVFMCGFLASGCPGTVNATVSNVLVTLAEVSFAGVVIGAIVCLFIKRVRFIGYGLLTMIFVAPIVGAIGCTVISGATHA